MTRVKPIDELRRALREELDLHSTFQWEYFLNHGVNAHFLARETGLDRIHRKLESVNSIWKQVSYIYPFEGQLILPKDKVSVAIYSRRAFVYGQLYTRVKMPNLTPIGNETVLAYYLGFENGSQGFNGIASFMLMTDSTGTNQLYGVVGGYAWTDVKIDVNKPSNFLTGYNRYRVLRSRNLIIFTINETPVLFAVPCVGYRAVKVKENVLPYSIALVEPLASSLTSLIEIYTNRTAEAPSDFIVPLSPYQFRISDGHEIIPLHLPLYVEDTSTKLAGYTVNSGTLVSHPFPVFGYTHKTFYFMANQSGTLEIQVMTQTGNWRTYDSFSYTANSFLNYPMTGDALLLARLLYTPSTYPATISEGEAVAHD
ncbi:MAG: hypothetical protein QXT14_02660 [Candidatus Bathyarchaeia archaeon]